MLIVANLDCEADYAAADRSMARPSLPPPVRRMISSAGALLAVFARPGDVLWTPEPIEPARLRLEVASDVTFVSGDLSQLAASGEILAWAETPAIAAMRRAAGGHKERQPRPGMTLGERLARLHPAPEVAMRANDRRYSLALATQWGLALPGSALLSSYHDFARHLAAGAHRAGHRQAWVLKAPFSASGRQRARRRGSELDAPTRTRVERLFARFGQLVFEPWMDRVIDFGCLGLVHAIDDVEVLSPHRLYNDPAGVFRGIAIEPDSWPKEAGDIAGAARQSAERVGRELASDGYRGPFGIDGFVYRDSRGSLMLHPLCEINARLSFGFIAHALGEDLPNRPLQLHLGSGPMPSHGSASGEPGQTNDHRVADATRLLIESDVRDRTHAWLAYPVRPNAFGSV